MATEEQKSVPDEIWTTEDVAQYLGVSNELVVTEAKASRLPHFQLGKLIRFRSASIRACSHRLHYAVLDRAGVLALANLSEESLIQGIFERTFPLPQTVGRRQRWIRGEVVTWLRVNGHQQPATPTLPITETPPPQVASHQPKLYLVVDAENGHFKVGVSIKPQSRWTAVASTRDCTRSFVWDCGKGAYRVERMIHILFSEFNRPRDGDGGTEWFAAECLSDVLAFLSTNMKRLQLR